MTGPGRTLGQVNASSDGGATWRILATNIGDAYAYSDLTLWNTTHLALLYETSSTELCTTESASCQLKLRFVKLS